MTVTPSTPETDPVVENSETPAAQPTDDAAAEEQHAAPTDADTTDREEDDPLATVTKERDEYLDDLRRARAEFENYRKRMAGESAAQRSLGRNDVVRELLEFADDLDRLVAAAEETDEGDLAKAITLLNSKWRQALTSLKVERIETTGVLFDPTEHDAVSQVPAEEPTDTPVVAEVMRVGYRSGERVLRPAMVIVAQ